MLEIRDDNRALRNENIKGGSGKKPEILDNLKEKEIEKPSFKLEQVLYLDHLLGRNVNPSQLEPVLRETVGRVVFENEYYVILCWDMPINALDLCDLESVSCLLILKSTIIERVSLNDQSLRSSYDTVYSPIEA